MKKENYDFIYKFEKDNWWYKAKRDLFLRILTKLDRKFDNALDLGCGVGSNFEILKKFSKKVVGIDNSSKAISYCKEKNYDALFKMDATKIQLPKNQFDLILCSDVLEHIDDIKAVKEIEKVLKPGGIFIFSVPVHMSLWGPNDNISKHLRRYEKERILFLLSSQFHLEKLSYWNLLMYPADLAYLSLLRIRGVKTEKNNLEDVPQFLNAILYRLLTFENRIFGKINIPQGVSAVGIARKKNG